jgi:hypothetical protein
MEETEQDPMSFKVVAGEHAVRQAERIIHRAEHGHGPDELFMQKLFKTLREG